MFRIVFALCSFVLTTISVAAEAPKTASEKARLEKARWTVDDVITSESASGFEISPDCRYVVWVKSAQDKDKGSRVSNLIRSSLTDKEHVELTRGPISCTA